MSVELISEAESSELAQFSLAFAAPDGELQRAPLSRCWSVAFEDCLPVRAFVSYKGQKNFPGLRWLATTSRHVGYESWLERDAVTLLDHDVRIVGLASQPFTLYWRDGRGDERRHTPDYFARVVDGSALVVDVKPVARVRQRDAEAFAMTARMCDVVGWTFRHIAEQDPVLLANLRWLAGYRHPRNGRASLTAAILGAFAVPTALFDGAAAVGDPIGVLPAIYHLLWRQVLSTDLALTPLNSSSLVWCNHGSDTA